jgi:dethiobiotin synthetase
LIMSSKPIFVTGIGTYVGKTIVSAVLCEQLQADYWKPVQAGDLDATDSEKVRSLISNPKTVIHPETYLLRLAASPHQSAAEEDIKINTKDFSIPQTDNQLLIEGAGGLFVPLSNDFLMIDLIRQFEAEVVVVVRNYLGCINHSLLSFNAVKTMRLPFKHVVLNGNFSEATLDIIIRHIPRQVSWSILPEFENLNPVTVALAPTQIL